MTLTIVKGRSPMRGIAKIARLQPKGLDHCAIADGPALSGPTKQGNDAE
jgi:hypothetical protein